MILCLTNKIVCFDLRSILSRSKSINLLFAVKLSRGQYYYCPITISRLIYFLVQLGSRMRRLRGSISKLSFCLFVEEPYDLIRSTRIFSTRCLTAKLCPNTRRRRQIAAPRIRNIGTHSTVFWSMTRNTHYRFDYNKSLSSME